MKSKKNQHIFKMKPKYGYYDVFVKTCAKFPSEIAVRVYEDDQYTSYTYSELYGVCEYIVQNIQQVTCDKGIIGLITERNAIVPSLIAACHKCSSTYMFIDPLQDIDTAVRDTKLNIIIHVKSLKQIKTDFFARSPDKGISVFNFEINIYNIGLDSQSSNFTQEHSYIAKTSGSTGNAKYIQVPIKCLQPNIDDLTKIFNITSKDVIYFSTPLTFDPSMVEIILACVSAASLLIAPEEAHVLFTKNKENSVTVWQTTPSKFFQYSDADIKNQILGAESTLRVLALGGEPLCGVRRLKELKHVANATKIFTLYGVTEMSCWACVGNLDLNNITDDKDVPLGNCLSETELFVKAKENNMGNIVLASKTRKCVVLNNTRNVREDSEALDTGDIGEVKDGQVYYRGRRDDVIKRFGNKVSLTNIEAIVMQHPNINSCSCVWVPIPKLLVVFYTSLNVELQELQIFLKYKLDDKEWPDKIIRLENLPISPHGKASKLILTQMINELQLLPQEIDVKALFLEELKLILNKSFIYNEICRKDYFSIGGSSILAVLMCNKLSLWHTDLGKQILPYLLNPKYSIEEIIDIMLKQSNILKKNPKKRKLSPSKTLSAVQRCITTLQVNCQVVWTHNTGKCVDATPTLFEDEFKVYATVGSHSGQIVVAEAKSGEINGKVSINSRVEASIACCNILSYPCGIVGTYDGTIVCFKLQDCKLLWQTNIGSMIKSKGVILNENFYVASYDGNIRVIDVINGKPMDTIHIVEHGISADLTLAQDKYVLVGTLSGTCACIDTTTKSVCWRIELGSPVFASPVLYNSGKCVVFAEVNGLLQCRTVTNGKKVWEFNEAKGHNIFSSLCFKKLKIGWKMIFGCHDNNVYCVVIRNSQPVLRWKTQLTSPVYSTPCWFRDKYIIAVSNNGVLCLISSIKGNIVSEYHLPNEVFSSPVILNNNIYIGCRDDNFYCIKCVDRVI